MTFAEKLKSGKYALKSEVENNKAQADFKKFTSYEQSPATLSNPFAQSQGQKVRAEKEAQSAQLKKDVNKFTNENPYLAGLITVEDNFAKGHSWGTSGLVQPERSETQKMLVESSNEKYNPSQWYLPSLGTIANIGGMISSPVSTLAGAGMGALNTIFGKGVAKAAPEIVNKLASTTVGKALGSGIAKSALLGAQEMGLYGGVSTSADIISRGDNLFDNKAEIAKSVLENGAFGAIMGGGGKAIGMGAKSLKNTFSDANISRGLDDIMGGYRPSIESTGIKQINTPLAQISDLTSFGGNKQLALPMGKAESRLKTIMDKYQNPSANVEPIGMGGSGAIMQNKMFPTKESPLQLKSGIAESPPVRPVSLGQAPKGKFNIKPTPEQIPVTPKPQLPSGIKLSSLESDIHATYSKAGMFDEANLAKLKQDALNENGKIFIEQRNYLNDTKGKKPNQGTLARDSEGNVVGRQGRVSNNEAWYQTWSKENRTWDDESKKWIYKKITNKELNDIAEKQLHEGFGDLQGGNIPLNDTYVNNKKIIEAVNSLMGKVQDLKPKAIEPLTNSKILSGLQSEAKTVEPIRKYSEQMKITIPKSQTQNLEIT